ncbi:hypothetical protein F5Y16DRAFT_389608 [Xylariaceae sp. FL0255]|nr:hypothetical protein F5Y16DRAFT_389608 [Xylariaceae sp. FL0255]
MSPGRQEQPLRHSVPVVPTSGGEPLDSTTVELEQRRSVSEHNTAVKLFAPDLAKPAATVLFLASDPPDLVHMGELGQWPGANLVPHWRLEVTATKDSSIAPDICFLCEKHTVNSQLDAQKNSSILSRSSSSVSSSINFIFEPSLFSSHKNHNPSGLLESLCHNKLWLDFEPHWSVSTYKAHNVTLDHQWFLKCCAIHPELDGLILHTGEISRSRLSSRDQDSELGAYKVLQLEFISFEILQQNPKVKADYARLKSTVYPNQLETNTEKRLSAKESEGMNCRSVDDVKEDLSGRKTVEDSGQDKVVKLGSEYSRNSELSIEPKKRRRDGIKHSEDAPLKPPTGAPTQDHKRPKAMEIPYGFACPFYKRYPWNFCGCLHYRLSKTSYVKQHLLRYHDGEADSCRSCHHQFSSRTECDRHVKHASCETCRCQVHFMTAEQKRRIQGAAGRKITHEEKWDQIWFILFPEAEKPESPYVKSHVFAEALTSIRDFCQGAGSHIIAETFRLSRERDLLDEHDIFIETLDQIGYHAWQHGEGQCLSRLRDPGVSRSTADGSSLDGETVCNYANLINMELDSQSTTNFDDVSSDLLMSAPSFSDEQGISQGSFRVEPDFNTTADFNQDTNTITLSQLDYVTDSLAMGFDDVHSYIKPTSLESATETFSSVDSQAFSSTQGSSSYLGYDFNFGLDEGEGYSFGRTSGA